ncbi:MAG TPA: Stp1/IreP family PP2C-type Ser/Thr phosphatase [Chthonomonadaceae bacterium]|nr:Stp1/IreP family PP2C-type Ser/Thr phosphatase [Chthonomonadaceae bacterium]
MTDILDPNELIKAGLIQPEEAPVRPEIKFGAKTDMGMKRENNEDKFDFYEPDDPKVLSQRGSLYAVCDGMGGAAYGQIASEHALNTLIEAYYKYYNQLNLDGTPIDVETALKNAILVANGVVRNYASKRQELSGMGTTLTVTAFVRNRVYIAQVGDSRAYLIRDEQIRQVTLDHSLVEEWRRMGRISEEEAARATYKNVITRSIGTQSTVEPDIYIELVKKADRWVLCTDGLTAYLQDEEIRQIALKSCPSEAVWEMVNLAKERGGHDNITAMVIWVRDLVPLAA